MSEGDTAPPAGPVRGGLSSFLTGHPATPETAVLHWENGELTLAELTAAARDLAGRIGPLAGASVACLVDGGAAAVTAMFATWLAGGVYVPVNARLSDAEVRGHLLTAAPALVIVDGAEADRVPAGLNRLERVGGLWIPVTVRASDSGTRYVEDAAIVMRTSGTTGASKPVVLTHEGVGNGIDTVIAKLRDGSSRRGGRAPMPNLVPTSLALWAGIWNTLFAFRLGAPAILLDRFDAIAYADLVKRFGIRSTILAPAMMNMLAEDPRVTELVPLKMVRSVTAPLTPAQARRFRERFGVAVLNSYGQTELGGEVAGWTAADLREFGDAKLGAVGRPHPGVTVRILDEERKAVEPGSVGELWITSPFATRGEKAIADRVMDGFLRTGDLGRVDADGFLWIEGRVSDMINRGGLKVVPQEVEEVLRSHPRITDACVAGVPDDRLGEVPVAWVIPAADGAPDEGSLQEFARRSLAGYKIPVAVRFVKDFPRTEIGKVLRRELVAGFDGPFDDGARSPDGTEFS
jgi:acyl-coenzyme A synthetase/AMP-(fatty) acid ligase